MNNYFKKTFALVALMLLTTACVGPYMVVYKNAKAANQAAAEKAEVNKRVAMEQDRKDQIEMKKQINAGEREIPIEFAHKLLIGTLKGNACTNKASVEINLTEGQRSGPWLRVKGSLRAVVQSGQSSGTVIETPVEGGYYLVGGFLGLKSSATPAAPPTKEQIDEENSKRSKANAEYKALESEYAHQLMKGQLAEAQTTKARGQQAYILESERISAHQKYWSTLPPIPPKFSVSLDIARDAEGKGWVGVIEGDGFESCHDIALTNDKGVVTIDLPSITGNFALQRAKPKNYSRPSTTAQIYWLNVAVNQGYDEALFYLAQVYEESGQHTPADYPLALQYYLKAANKIGDARAQKALDHMYSEGLGTAKNLAEAKKWRSLAAKTSKASAEICASPKTIAAIDSIMKDERNKLRLMEAGLVVLTGTSMNTGNVRLVRVSPDDVISLDKPFLCRVVGKRIDPTVDASGVPSFLYGGADTNGVEYFYDNRLDKAGKTVVAGITETLAKHFPYLDSFRIEPLGNRKYTLTPANRSRQYSVPIDLP